MSKKTKIILLLFVVVLLTALLVADIRLAKVGQQIILKHRISLHIPKDIYLEWIKAYDSFPANIPFQQSLKYYVRDGSETARDDFDSMLYLVFSSDQFANEFVFPEDMSVNRLSEFAPDMYTYGNNWWYNNVLISPFQLMSWSDFSADGELEVLGYWVEHTEEANAKQLSEVAKRFILSLHAIEKKRWQMNKELSEDDIELRPYGLSAYGMFGRFWFYQYLRYGIGRT